jgi:predicted metalloprotease with PDZ domain
VATRAFRLFSAWAVLAFGGAMTGSLRAEAGVGFTIAAPSPASHVYRVRMSIPSFAKRVRSFDLVMPAWTPGSYFIRDFARNVVQLEASGPRGEALGVRKVEKGRWRVSVPDEGSPGPFTADYRVYANELTVRTSHLDETHAYGNGPGLFLYVDGRKDEPHSLRFDLPAGWKASIALPGRDGVFLARDYDELVDSPFECGTHRTIPFTVRGVPHEVAIWGDGNEDASRLARDLARIVEAGATQFGGLPYERYLFLVHLADGARGGLEHRASQSVGIGPWRFRPEKSYRSVLALLSHEYFHAWMVKRIRPDVLGPFEYDREVYTRDLWAMEGITSYYEWILLLRAGLLEPRHVFEEWAKEIRDHRETPGSKVQSAEDASFDAWIRLYRPDENSANVSESYYRRGALIALGLDLSIRRETDGGRSLDDVLRDLDGRYGAKGTGYPDGEWERAIRRSTGFDAASFFGRYVRGRETPPFESLLGAVGLELRPKAERPEGSGEENGGKDLKRSDFGWKTKAEAGKVTVTEVYDGRPARVAGIDAGDELVSFDGRKADEGQVDRIERDALAGTTVRVHFFRRSVLSETPLVLGEPRPSPLELKERADAGADARRLYSGWVGRPFPEGGAAPPRD